MGLYINNIKKEGDLMSLFEPRDYKTIPRWKDVSEEQWNDPRWQRINSITDVDTLAEVIKLTEHQREVVDGIVDDAKKDGKHLLRITPYYAMLMAEDPFNPTYSDGESLDDKLDPVFWLSVPTPTGDPSLLPNAGMEELMDEKNRSFGAAYQRYPNRVALFVGDNRTCYSYCGHCQRRSSLDANNGVGDKDIRQGLYYISVNPNIKEVLVTGGDALGVSEERLSFILGEIGKIDHVKSVRIATRAPVVAPMSVTDEMLDIIDNTVGYSSDSPKNVYFMTHVNHYHEVTQDFVGAVRRMKMRGYSVLNQTVLLNHVNADFETLALTQSRLFHDAGVKPYYVFQCHNEAGLPHFVTPVQLGQRLTQGLRGVLSGTALPTYAMNAKHGGGKVVLTPTGLTDIFDEEYNHSLTLATWDGNVLEGYEPLGKATSDEYGAAVRVMDEFIGREGVYLPNLMIIDGDGRYTGETTNVYLPSKDELSFEMRARMLNYDCVGLTPVEEGVSSVPETNPSRISDELETGFAHSSYCREGDYTVPEDTHRANSFSVVDLDSRPGVQRLRVGGGAPIHHSQMLCRFEEDEWDEEPSVEEPVGPIEYVAKVP